MNLPLPLRRVLRRIRRTFVDARVRRQLGLPRGAIRRGRRELRQDGITRHLGRAARRIDELLDGQQIHGLRATSGALGDERRARLYAIVRHRRPDLVVETGVCNGFSSAIVLAALGRNGGGRLVSIDLPAVVGSEVPGGAGGAAVPSGHEPGWVAPQHLRHRWELLLGPSRELLPSVLHRLGRIDLFLHDSEHTYENMVFEFEAALGADASLVLADDADWNEALSDVARRHGHRVLQLGEGLAGFVVAGPDGDLSDDRELGRKHP